MNEILEQFRQIILYGPPGTGKTREATRLALSLLTGKKLSATTSHEEIDKQLKRFHGDRFELVVFHPAYEYEQFVGGIEPTANESGQVGFKAKEGTFLRLCRKAEKQPEEPAVLIIDEINRGSLPKLRGELVYALKYRDKTVTLPFEVDKRSDLVIPRNLYIIATMNTSDRSIGHIDMAIRRRFALCHVEPDADVVRSVWNKIDKKYGERLAKLMEELNQRLKSKVDATSDVEAGVGHSYFLPNPDSRADAKVQVQNKWQHQVQSLLHEYAQLLNLDRSFFQQYGQDLNAALSND